MNPKSKKTGFVYSYCTLNRETRNVKLTISHKKKQQPVDTILQPKRNSFSADRTVQATMLKKMKGKMKRRNTEPTMQVMGPSGIQMTLAAPQEPEEVDSNNTDF